MNGALHACYAVSHGVAMGRVADASRYALVVASLRRLIYTYGAHTMRRCSRRTIAGLKTAFQRSAVATLGIKKPPFQH